MVSSPAAASEEEQTLHETQYFAMVLSAEVNLAQ